MSMFSYDIEKSKSRVNEAAVAIVELMELHLDTRAKELCKLLRKNFYRAICDYEELNEQRMKAYDVLNDLRYCAGWNNDDHTLNNEQKRKMKILLDNLNPDELCSREISYDNFESKMEEFHKKMEAV